MAVQNLGVISVNLWQILISLANLCIMFLILKRFLFKPVAKMMAERQSQVDGLYTEAEKSKTEAEAMKSEYESNMATARQEADRIVRDATATAASRDEKMLIETTNQVSRMKQKAEEEIAQEKQKMMQDARSEISDLAVDIASKVIGREINAKDHEELLDDFIGNVGDDK